MILNNPLIERYRCSMMRPAFLWIYAAMYVILVALMLFINYALYYHQHIYSSPATLFRSIYYQFLIFQTLLLWIFSSYNTGSAIITEIAERSYDFFKLLPMSAHKKAIGIIIGRNQIILLLAGVNCLLLLGFGIASHIPFTLQAQIAIFLITSTTLMSCLALLSSTQAKSSGKPNKNSALVLSIIAFYGAMIFVGSMQDIANEGGVELHRIDFYSLKVPILLTLSAMAAYLSGWAYKGSLRGLNNPNEPVFTPVGAWLFQIGYILILLGFFSPFLPPQETWLVHLFWIISLVPAVCIPFSSLRSVDKYLELTKPLRPASNSDSHINTSILLLKSNLFTAAVLLAIWAVFSCGLSVLHGNIRLDIWNMITICSFYAVIILLSEVYIVFTTRKSGKLQYLVAFLVALHTFLPLILAPILESDTLYSYSYIGFVVRLFDPTISKDVHFTSIIIVNILLCVVPAMLIARKYREIISVRESM